MATDLTTAVANLPDGLRLPYVEQGERTGQILLFVHGVGDSGHAFDAVLSRLPTSLHALAATLRGHGDASRPQHGYRSSDFAQDVAALLAALGIEAVIAIGASSGGQVALRLALDHPKLVRGLVLLGAPLRLGDKPDVWKAWNTTFSKLTDPIDPQFLREFLDSIVARPLPQRLRESLVGESLKTPAFVWRETMAGLLDDDPSAELAHLAAPALILWGDHDTVLPRQEQEELASRIPQARLVVYEGGGHAFYWEDPGRVAADIAAFARSLSTGTGQ